MNKKKLNERAQEFCAENHIDEYPVKIIGLCNKYGIEVYGAELPDDMSGFILIQDEPLKNYPTGRLIVHNKKDSLKRQRFTIAHELAHYILHRDKNDKIYAHRDVGQTGGIEAEANYFAAQILMPAELVFKALKKLEKELRYVPYSMKARYIADEFAVSEEAAHIRLEQLGVFF